MAATPHYSVLLQESVSALLENEGRVYVDGTFGRGGHSAAILKSLQADGKLIAFDKDPQAVSEGESLQRRDARLCMQHASFADLKRCLESKNIAKVDGILLDLGVSSPQLDEAERGFSFLHDGPLDMRMDNTRGQSAAEWVNGAKEEDIAWVLKHYGEERFARRMARAIVQRRSEKVFERTGDLAKVVSEANPAWEKGKHPATRAFQAIRIAINEELQDLEKVLVDSVEMLNEGGRIVVISFHSLEDRIVKRFFRDQSKGRSFPMGMPVTEAMLDKKLKLVGKATKASAAELEDNIRSRSAVMRVAERLAEKVAE